MTKQTNNLRPLLQRGLDRLGMVDESGLLIDSLLAYLDELIRWNKAYNLTAVRDPQEMVIRHLLDAYSVQPYITGGRIIDVGTGAGLPGIPLALANPQQFFVLLDSNGKKVRFLEHVVRTLDLPNVTPVQARVDDYTEGGWFDTVVCRAFSSLREFAEGAGHLAAPEGRLVAMKGKVPAEELADVPDDWVTTGVDPVAVPGLEAERHIVVLHRNAATMLPS